MRTRRTKGLLLALLIATMMPLTSLAQTAASLSIEDFTINAGETADMLIDLNNPNDQITLVQFDLRLPNGLTIAKENGEYVYDIAGRTSWRNHSLNVNDTGDGSVRFLMASSSNAVISGTSGAVISIRLSASATFNGGDIKLEKTLLVTPQAKETKPADYVYTLEGQTESSTPTLSIEDFTISAGEEAEMLIDLNNPNDQIVGVQFDLRLPEGLSVLSEDDEYYVFIAGRTTSSNHYMYVYPKSDGTVTVYMIPTGTTPISGTSGAIISIELTASATFKGGDIRLENIGLATPEGVQFSIDDYVYTLGGQTGQNITFADPEVKRICVENWDTNGDGELSMDEAAAVTDLGCAFYETLYDAESFDEFEYFTGLTHIEPYALDGLHYIRSIVIPKNVSEIEYPEGFSMFYDMEDFRVAKDNKTYDSRNDCNALIETATNTLLAGFNTTVIPNSVQHIGYSAFEYRYMWSGTIPEGVLTIGEGAFCCCLFEELTIPSTVTTIGEDAFESCDIEDLYIPGNVICIGEYNQEIKGVTNVEIIPVSA